MIEVISPGLQYYVDRINNAEPFSLVRYGDGEWAAVILQNKARNCDLTSLTIPGLVTDLRLSLMNPPLTPNYIMALRPATANDVPQVKQWLDTNVPKQIQWHECRVFCHASIKGNLYPLVEALRNLNMPLVFIGPAHLQGLKKIFPKAQHIIVADVDCYHDKAAIFAQILSIGKPAFFSFSAGPAAKVFIHQLFPTIGNKSFMIDLGSLWSVYCGHKIRSYHHTLSLDTIQRNLK